MSAEARLWEAMFIIEGVHLSENQVMIGNCLRFEKLSEEESRGMWLPAWCFVKVRCLEQHVEQLAKRLLEDYIGIYSVIGNIAIERITYEGARSLEGEKVQIVTLIGCRSPDWNREESYNKLKVSEAIRGSTDLNAARNSYMRTALDYCRYAGQANRPEEKLINCIIGLEALYLREIQELSYRLSHRVAALLGETDEGRNLIFQNVRALYDKRSKIAHGESISISAEDIKLALEYLRKSIKLFLALSQEYSRDNVIDVLDLAILNSQKRREIQEKSRQLFEEKWGRVDE